MRVTLLVLAAFLALAFADEPEWTKCSESSDEICNISEIRVDPCKNRSFCKFKKGKKATIDIDYTPSFSGDKIKTGLFWASENGDVPFAELNDANACDYTACPVQAGSPQHFHYSLHVGKKLPTVSCHLVYTYRDYLFQVYIMSPKINYGYFGHKIHCLYREV